jgi:hypothetical protein
MYVPSEYARFPDMVFFTNKAYFTCYVIIKIGTSLTVKLFPIQQVKIGQATAEKEKRRT